MELINNKLKPKTYACMNHISDAKVRGLSFDSK